MAAAPSEPAIVTSVRWRRPKTRRVDQRRRIAARLGAGGGTSSTAPATA
jgi:hypothetical protein